MTPKDESSSLRTGIDPAASERHVDDLVACLRADDRTRVIVVHDDQVPTTDTGAVAFVSPGEVPGAREWAFLGRGFASGGVLLAVILDRDRDVHSSGIASWSSLRTLGATLPDSEAAVLVTAVSLARWLIDSPFCPRCGGATEVVAAGWARRCRQCGREHFPRTDPAVIVAIAHPDGERLLLGKNIRWAERNMYSAFAGFVEAGESAEAAIEREIAEEAGVRVGDIRYRGSQAWPYPRSLMLGFHAVALDPAAAKPDGEEIVDVRWFGRDELRSAFAGDADFVLPGAASIAHRLIRTWVDAAAPTSDLEAGRTSTP